VILVAEACADCAKGIICLLSNKRYSRNYHDGDKDQEKGVLDQRLSFFFFEQARKPTRDFYILFCQKIRHLSSPFVVILPMFLGKMFYQSWLPASIVADHLLLSKKYNDQMKTNKSGET